MLKLYKNSSDATQYWETWDNGDGSHTVHWGRLGERGESTILKSSILSNARNKIQKEIDRLVVDGYHQIDTEEHARLMIEYAVEGHGDTSDIDKRHRLEERMNEALGWTGLGLCDGGSIGSGTMEVCCYVVDFDIAKAVIETNLKGTEFENYTRIYNEDAAGA